MAIDDPQDRAEALDDDRLSDEYPPEDPLGVEEYGTTAAEERYGEPLEERVLREEPPGDGGHDDDPPVLVDLDTVEGPGDEGRAVAGSVEDDPGALDVDDPTAGDPSLRDVATERTGPVPAEEAAVHVSDR